MSSNSGDRRKTSVSTLDKEKLAKLQHLKAFQNSASIASRFLKMKSPSEESAAAAISLSKAMARKKGADLSLQIEIETESQWKSLLRKEGLIVVEVYSGWCGPCLSMVSFLKKVKLDTNDDRLTLATVNSDNIGDVRIFRGQSEPAWLFIGGGKPVRLIRGANSASLVAAIKSEFEYELMCMDGKAKRNLISIKDEAERRHKAQSEAIHLASVQKKEVESTVVAFREPITATPKQRSISHQNSEDEPEVVAVDLFPAMTSTHDTKRNDTVTDAIQQRLMTSLESYAVLAIQGFLLETGAVTEIKDLLREEFTIAKERYVFLEEAGVRRLFGIPFEVEELIEDEEIPDDDKDINNTVSEMVKDELDVSANKADSEIGEESSAAEDKAVEVEEEPMKVKEPRYRKVPVPLPKELCGDTLLFLLESIQVAKQKEQDPEATLAKTADDHLRFKLGPTSYKIAVDNEPKSMLALYGREEYAVGVWCPRKHEDKEYVMLNFFPQLVTEMLMPPPKEMPKYMVAIFPALFSNEIMEHPELVANTQDIVAQGKMKLTSKFVDRILKSNGLDGEDLEAQKKSLTGFDMFAVSIDERNEALSTALISLEPIHYSVNNDNGRFETAKLFPHLNILIDNDFEDEFYPRDLIIEKFLARPKLKLAIIFGDDDMNIDEGGGVDGSLVP